MALLLKTTSAELISVTSVTSLCVCLPSGSRHWDGLTNRHWNNCPQLDSQKQSRSSQGWMLPWCCPLVLPTCACKGSYLSTYLRSAKPKPSAISVFLGLCLCPWPTDANATCTAYTACTGCIAASKLLHPAQEGNWPGKNLARLSSPCPIPQALSISKVARQQHL